MKTNSKSSLGFLGEGKHILHKIGITAYAEKPINQYVESNTKNKTRKR